MSFIRKISKEPTVMKSFQGGMGAVLRRDILNGSDEMYGKGRVFSHMVLEKNCEVGNHAHVGDGEVFYILKGQGLLTLNGEIQTVSEGDVIFTDDGESHSLLNPNDEPLEFIALVLYSK